MLANAALILIEPRELVFREIENGASKFVVFPESIHSWHFPTSNLLPFILDLLP